eukprot:scaffold660415_cov31-Prasinocladus_malaysianus.AAC.1
MALTKLSANRSFGVPNYTGIVDCMRKTAVHEGVGALYKGMGAAMIGVAPYAGIKFCVYELSKKSAAQWMRVADEDLPSQ